MLMCSLLTGKTPREGLSVPIDFQVALRIVGRVRPAINVKLPPNVIDLIRRTRDDDPAKRPNFDEVVKLLMSKK
jgi:serine/threonine protein kinase